MSLQTFSDPFANDTDLAPRATFLSLVHADETLAKKATPMVAARRARFTRIVKIVLGVAAVLCILGVGRATFASAKDEATGYSESASDADRVVRGVDLAAAKAPSPRAALKQTLHSTKALLTHAALQR